MTLNGVPASRHVLDKPHTSNRLVIGFRLRYVYCFSSLFVFHIVRIRHRRESSRSLSHLLMSFLFKSWTIGTKDRDSVTE